MYQKTVKNLQFPCHVWRGERREHAATGPSPRRRQEPLQPRPHSHSGSLWSLGPKNGTYPSHKTTKKSIGSVWITGHESEGISVPNLREGPERLRGPLWLHGPGATRLPRRLLPQHHLHSTDDLQAVLQRAAE